MISTSVSKGLFFPFFSCSLPIILEKYNPSLPGECVLEFFRIDFLYFLNARKKSGMSCQPFRQFLDPKSVPLRLAVSVPAVGNTWNTRCIYTTASQTDTHTNCALIGEIRPAIRLARVIITRNRRMILP